MFLNPVLPTKPKLTTELTKLVDEDKAHENPVFLYIGRDVSALFMMMVIDSHKDIVQFKWRIIAHH